MMTRHWQICLLVFVGLTAATTPATWGEESILQRMHPYRFFRTRPGPQAESTQARVQPGDQPLSQRGVHPIVNDQSLLPQRPLRQNGPNLPVRGEGSIPSGYPSGRPTWTHQHAIADNPPSTQHVRHGGWLGQRSPDGRPPTLDELRAHLESRGVDPARLDNMALRAGDAGQEAGKFGQTGRYGSPADLQQLRTELELRGVDAAAIEARVAERSEVRERMGPANRQMDDVAAPAPSDARTRLERGGLPPAALESRFGPSSQSPRERADAGSMRGTGLQRR